jgi:hypothetical protein
LLRTLFQSAEKKHCDVATSGVPYLGHCSVHCRDHVIFVQGVHSHFSRSCEAAFRGPYTLGRRRSYGCISRRVDYVCIIVETLMCCGEHALMYHLIRPFQPRIRCIIYPEVVVSIFFGLFDCALLGLASYGPLSKFLSLFSTVHLDMYVLEIVYG